MQDYKELIVWQKTHTNVLLVYKHAREFSKEEQFGHTNQLRSAASSIPANIAEGAGKLTSKDFAHYLQSAPGSAQEAEYFRLLGNCPYQKGKSIKLLTLYF